MESLQVMFLIAGVAFLRYRFVRHQAALGPDDKMSEIRHMQALETMVLIRSYNRSLEEI
jgi:hypothetical protein